MKEKELCWLVRISIIAIFLCGICLCTGWYPFYVSLNSMGNAADAVSSGQDVLLWLQLIFFWVVSLPCFIILGIAWKISATIIKGTLFSKQNSGRIKACSHILAVDSIVLAIGNTVFLFLGVNVFAIVYYFLAVAGLIVSAFLAVLSYYTGRAANLQEESDGTL